MPRVSTNGSGSNSNEHTLYRNGTQQGEGRLAARGEVRRLPIVWCGPQKRKAVAGAARSGPLPRNVMSLAWQRMIDGGYGHPEMAAEWAFTNVKSGHAFSHTRKPAKILRTGLYARVATNDQQTLAMQKRAMRASRCSKRACRSHSDTWPRILSPGKTRRACRTCHLLLYAAVARCAAPILISGRRNLESVMGEPVFTG